MKMKRNSSSTANLVDGKIYVAGGYKDKYLSYPNWIEVFDPKTQTWSSVTNPHIFELHHEFRNKGFVAKSLGLEGKLYMFGDQNEVYDPKEDKWTAIGVDRPMSWAVNFSSYCVVDDLLFFWDREVFKWYDCKVRLWKELNGVEGLSDFRGHKYCKMVDLGEKMAVLWDTCEYTQKCDYILIRIWCAEIALERRDGDEIWGKVEWFDAVLTFPVSEEEHRPATSFDALSAFV